MSVDFAFPKQVVALLLGMAAMAAFPLARYASPEVIVAATTGALLSTVNVLLGYLAIEYAFDKSYTTFLKVVLGGMGIRMLVMLGLLGALIALFDMHAAALTVSLLGSYAVFLALEILHIQKKVVRKNEVPSSS